MHHIFSYALDWIDIIPITLSLIIILFSIIIFYRNYQICKISEKLMKMFEELEPDTIIKEFESFKSKIVEIDNYNHLKIQSYLRELDDKLEKHHEKIFTSKNNLEVYIIDLIIERLTELTSIKNQLLSNNSLRIGQLNLTAGKDSNNEN